jgi:NAD(P)-dependent dehydrogenase (short-subunit alcohol dehydrogenase family)
MSLNSREEIGAERVKEIYDSYPLGVGKPEDVSPMVLFLLSDAARWITGTDVVIDGGSLAGMS